MAVMVSINMADTITNEKPDTINATRLVVRETDYPITILLGGQLCLKAIIKITAIVTSSSFNGPIGITKKTR